MLEVPQSSEDEVLYSVQSIEEPVILDIPAIAVHLIYREYVTKNNIEFLSEMESGFPTYLESRLKHLYPNIVQTGFINEAMNKYNAFKSKHEGQFTDDEYEIPERLPTLESDIEELDLTEEEIALWLDIESYVENNRLVSIEDINLLTERYNLGGSRGVGLTIVIIGAVAVVVSGGIYVIIRAIQARNRSNNRSIKHFGSTSGSGDKIDAFQHIYASMHLRRYVGKWMAALIGWGKELVGGNECNHKEMDKHNNKVGRATKYYTFRYGNNAGKKDWRQWAKNVRDYVNNLSNQEDFSNDWKNLNFPQDCNTVEDDVDETSELKYIIVI